MNEETNKTIHYIVYKITNKINGKIYVGQHQTRNLDDGYMGSSAVLKAAIKKYGLENFTKEIIRECSSHEEMNDLEAEIVNPDFVARKDTYNLSVGGTYGWENVNKVMRKDPERFKMMQLHAAEALRKVCKTTEHRQKMSEIKKRYFELHDGAFTGKNHSEETKRKMSESHKRNGNHCGEKNGSYGKHWWMNPETGESKSFGEDEVVPKGWIRGRRCNVSEEGRKIMSKNGKKVKHENTSGCKWINNGQKNRLLKPSEELPDGWKYGAIQNHFSMGCANGKEEDC